MNTAFLLSVIAFLAVDNMHSQEKDVEFNRLHTRKLTLKGQSVPEIYNVSFATTDESINTEYTKLKSELETLIADSISKKNDYEKVLARYNDITIIKDKTLEFNSSTNAFGNKVTLLKEAQILASKHNITELFYSDNDINKEMKAGFLLLSLNPEDLKTHLNKVLLRLDKIKVPKIPEYIAIADLRNKISHTKNANVCMLQNDIVPAEDLTGDFMVVNSYYVVSMPTKGFIKNQLVSKTSILNSGITKEKLYSYQEKMLIKNKQTKEMYLVDTSFINTFSVKS